MIELLVMSRSVKSSFVFALMKGLLLLVFYYKSMMTFRLKIGAGRNTVQK